MDVLASNDFQTTSSSATSRGELCVLGLVCVTGAAADVTGVELRVSRRSEVNGSS